ncbi:serine/threonine-protein kinase [Nocardia sp. NPDC050712]|uniref:serine/threonine-protein kinase n=1 Tax=Nocardia sp. NPDC050712 TaxID=3155518 RepID=UPI003410CC4F
MAEKIAPGTIFAGYRIERVLGSGGMGTVYLAAHPRLPRHDAVKVLSGEHAADPEFRTRFGREAELVARLDHPNIVAVRDRGAEHGRLWIAMQFVAGTDAAALIAAHPGGVAPAVAVHILTEAAAGLDAAHGAGLLHRDVKPANLLLEVRPDAPDRVYVTDFGIARAADSAALTDVGAVLATPAYAAPEQITAGALDHRADVYALGCTLYELLTGAKPFPRASAVAVMHAHLNDPPPRASAVRPALPAAIDDVIATALAKHPDRRYESCGELAAAAAAAFGGSARPRPPVRRRRRPIAAVVAVALVLAGLLAVGLVVRDRDPGPTGSAPTTSSVPVTSSTAAAVSPVSWGNYAYVAAALPTLLPANPIGGGYQGIRCYPVDAEMKQISLTDRSGSVLRLSCTGNQDPVEWIVVSCNANRAPTTLPPSGPGQMTVTGEQRMTRSAGPVRLIWGDALDSDGKQAGLMRVEFDDVARNFCSLLVWGGGSGQELIDRWWRDAPL